MSCLSITRVSIITVVAYTIGLLMGWIFSPPTCPPPTSPLPTDPHAWQPIPPTRTTSLSPSVTEPASLPPASSSSKDSNVITINSLDDRRRDVTSSFSALFSIPMDTACPPLYPLDITYVSFTSIDRAWMIPHLCNRWPGPMVISLYIHNNITSPRNWDEASTLNLFPNLQILQVHDTSPVWDPSAFPINRLRNLAIQRVATSHFVTVDIDLWPDAHMYHHLKDLLANHLQQPFLSSRQALVIPAFEFTSAKPPIRSKEDTNEGKEREEEARLVDRMPLDRQSLEACLDLGQCKPFYSQFRHQTSTDFDRWRHQSPWELQHVPCFKSFRYEPYVVLRRCPPTPLYAEVFTGYGKNKVEYITHLRYLGYNFSVVGQSFVMHYPHRQSEAARLWDNKKGKHYQRMESQFQLFNTWLDKFLASSDEVTPLCQEAEELNPLSRYRKVKKEGPKDP